MLLLGAAQAIVQEQTSPETPPDLIQTIDFERNDEYNRATGDEYVLPVSGLNRIRF